MLGRGLSIVRQALALIMVSVTLGLLKVCYKRLTNRIKRGPGPLVLWLVILKPNAPFVDGVGLGLRLPAGTPSVALGWCLGVGGMDFLTDLIILWAHEINEIKSSLTRRGFASLLL